MMMTLQPPITEPIAVHASRVARTESTAGRELITYAAVGVLLGIVLVKSEAVSWYRIQEMFRFQSFHMYGILGSAMVVAIVGKAALKKLKMRSSTGNEIVVT